MEISKVGDYVTVNKVFPNSPAEQGGVLEGDKIAIIDTVNARIGVRRLDGRGDLLRRHQIAIDEGTVSAYEACARQVGRSPHARI
mgnify:CR=1 FL=1